MQELKEATCQHALQIKEIKKLMFEKSKETLGAHAKVLSL